ncbi:DUF885 domain-containing protein [Novosphingobium profundi]|uniref:DUF885 domain-containing protein n=1 Tax=Novosphingobium profundi TaxID=1774954 RepID=UPI001CFC4B93|nr:DUF885 family protein [Novosphingobium profundi]
MQRPALRALLLAATTLAMAPLPTEAAAPASEAGAKATSAADGAFEALYTSEWEWRRSLWGPDEDNPQDTPALPDVGPEAQAEKLARWSKVKAKLSRIDTAALSRENQINYAVYANQIDALLTEQQYRDYEKPFNADTSFWGNLAARVREPVKDEPGARAMLAMLRDIPRYYDQQIANMRAGIARGFTAPRVTLAGRDEGIAQVIAAGASEQNVFFAPFADLPDTIPQATRTQIEADALRVIKADVIPAHGKLLAFLRNEYTPAARTSLGADKLPDGRAYYLSKIREFTTLEKTPEEIHQLGLAEMARIRARMDDVMREVGFTGTLGEFFEHLRTDPQFYPKTPEELLYRAAWIAKSFDGKASQYFGRLPRSRFAIKPVPDDIAPFYTGGRGGPGIYLVNTYDLPSRPFYSQVALTLHESAPGHAFQMPLAAENTALPAFRRDTYLSAYGEGWALYCEALGEDMDMYETPYDLFGMLSYQAWRASRLVVDTGIHAKGWTREEAQDYLRSNTALSNHEIETEVDRYISWPGQALSYYMGELAFLDARRKAKAALGEKFNIRAFHDAVLEIGSVPLPLIDARVDQLIAEGGVGPYPDEE